MISIRRGREKAEVIRTPKEAGLERIRNVIAADNMSGSTRMQNVIKSDFFFLMSNYMEIDPESIQINVDCAGESLYMLKIEARAKRIFTLNVAPADD